MPLYCVRWPNGNFSVVDAANKDDASVRLDQWGPVEPRDIHRLKEFMADFKMNEDGFMELLQFGEEVDETIRGTYYPLLDEYLMETCMNMDPDEEAIAVMVRKEADRVKWDEPEMVEGAEVLQTIMRCSSAYAKAAMEAAKQAKEAR